MCSMLIDAVVLPDSMTMLRRKGSSAPAGGVRVKANVSGDVVMEAMGSPSPCCVLPSLSAACGPFGDTEYHVSGMKWDPCTSDKDGDEVYMADAVDIAWSLDVDVAVRFIKNRRYQPLFYDVNSKPVVGLVENTSYLSKWKPCQRVKTECLLVTTKRMKALIFGKDTCTNQLLAAEGQLLRCILACPLPERRLALLKMWCCVVFHLVGFNIVSPVLVQVEKLSHINLEKRTCAGGPKGMLGALIGAAEARLCLENTWYWALVRMEKARRTYEKHGLSVKVCPEHVNGCTVVDWSAKFEVNLPGTEVEPSLPMMMSDDDYDDFSGASGGGTPPSAGKKEVDVDFDALYSDFLVEDDWDMAVSNK